MKVRSAMIGLTAISACLLMPLQINAQETKKNAEAGKDNMTAYLGVAVEPLQPVLAKQLPDLRGRGIVIAQVAKGSPAEKAGVKAHDILLSYDEHQIYAPEQLVKLVQHDKSGRHAVLVVMSAGKEKKVDVTLGEHAVVAHVRNHPQMGMEDMHPFTVRPHDHEMMWQSFDSLTLSRLDNDRFKAEISYKADKGKIERKSFEGTRQEIHKAIEKQKDLPAAEREQLLRALDLGPRSFEFGMPHFFVNPRRGALWDFEDLDHLFNDSSPR